MPQHSARIITAALATVLATATALAGCAPTPASTAKPSTSTSANPSSSSTPQPSATPTDPPTPVSLACDQLVTADQMYAFNPNFGVAPDYAPAQGSLQRQIADWKGTTCAWQNQTSDEIIQVAVAKPPASQLETLKNAAITVAQAVPTYGTPPIEGYFKAGKTGQAGQVQIFSGPYWVVAESTAFFEPGDAAQLMENVLGNLPPA